MDSQESTGMEEERKQIRKSVQVHEHVVATPGCLYYVYDCVALCVSLCTSVSSVDWRNRSKTEGGMSCHCCPQDGR